MFCMRCLNEAQRTDWKPPRGYNPDLVEYKCGNCGHVSYMRRHQHHKAEDAEQEAAEKRD